MRKMLFIGLALFICIVPNTSQSNDTACSAYIQEVMPRIADNCGGMGVNEACYGNNRVDATFWEEQPEAMFSQPSDRVSLSDVQSIATAPLSLEDELWGVAILNVQSNLGYTLPGQAVRFLLMGDARIENDVSPNDLLIGGEPIIGIVNSGANVRSQPSTNANVVGGFAAGDEVQVVGTTEANDWFEVLVEERGSGWVWAELVGMGETSTLPITYKEDTPLYAPMQAFYFTAGIGELQCNEAPNAMIIQKPEGDAIILRINDLNITLGSMIVVTLDKLDGQKVLAITLLKGHIEAESDSVSFALDKSGDTVIISVNDDWRIDNDSELLDADVTDTMQSVCNNASNMSILEGLTVEDCDIEASSVDTTSSQPTNTQTNSLAGIPDDGTCTVAATNTINLRGGPGTNYNREGQLSASELANPDGKATGGDGYLWWRLDNGSWVRSDLVDMGGDCDNVPVVAAPEPPTPAPNQATTGSTNVTKIYTSTGSPGGGPGCFTPSGSTKVIIQHGYGGFGTVEEANTATAVTQIYISLDGQPIPITSSGISPYDPDGSWLSVVLTDTITLTPGIHQIDLVQIIPIRITATTSDDGYYLPMTMTGTCFYEAK